MHIAIRPAASRRNHQQNRTEIVERNGALQQSPGAISVSNSNRKGAIRALGRKERGKKER